MVATLAIPAGPPPRTHPCRAAERWVPSAPRRRYISCEICSAGGYVTPQGWNADPRRSEAAGSHADPARGAVEYEPVSRSPHRIGEPELVAGDDQPHRVRPGQRDHRRGQGRGPRTLSLIHISEPTRPY